MCDLLRRAIAVFLIANTNQLIQNNSRNYFNYWWV